MGYSDVLEFSVNRGSGSGTAVELLPYSARDPGSIQTTDAASTEFGLSPQDLVGFLRVLWFPPTLQRHTGLSVNWLW